MKTNGPKHSLILSITLIISFIHILFSSFQDQNNNYVKVNEGKVKFISDAPLEKIIATSNKLSGVVDTSNGQFAFRIPMSSFIGFNSKLQKEHFEENYLEVVKFPNATFTGKIIEKIDFNKNGEHTVRAKGNFSIHGISKEFIIKSNINILNQNITIKSEFNITLKDFNIPIPQMVKEKISENVTILVSIGLK